MNALPDLFPGFEKRTFKTSGAEIFARIGGEGPPLLLLHGYPQCHVMWHELAPALSVHFTCIFPDLRGYGSSSAPETDETHYAYSKRAMGEDFFELMDQLGHDTFTLIGHDRGARVGYRMALDKPEQIKRLALLDIVPTHTVWQHINIEDALKKYHWTFLAQPTPLPENLIARAPIDYLEHTLASWTASHDLSAFSETALSHYRAFFSEPERIHAMCEDYRAGASYDLIEDDKDVGEDHKITCPTLVLWGENYSVGTTSNTLEVWREWCVDVQGHAINSGHFLAEENPQETIEALLAFLLLE